MEIQDGGPYHCNLFISAPRQDSHAIATAIPTFYGSGIPMGQVSVLYNQNGRNRKWKIQDGGLDHCNAYISALRLDCNSITTAIPMFSGSSIPMGKVLTLFNQNGRNRKWEIQDGGPYHCNAYISAPRLDCNKITTAIPMFLGSSFSRDKCQYCTTKVEGTGSGRYKMAASTP